MQKNLSTEVSLCHTVLEVKIANFYQNHVFSGRGRMPSKKKKIQNAQSNMPLKWQLSYEECAISVLSYQPQTALPLYKGHPASWSSPGRLLWEADRGSWFIERRGRGKEKGRWRWGGKGGRDKDKGGRVRSRGNKRRTEVWRGILRTQRRY